MTLPLFLLPDMAYAADVATRLDAIAGRVVCETDYVSAWLTTTRNQWRMLGGSAFTNLQTLNRSSSTLFGCDGLIALHDPDLNTYKLMLFEAKVIKPKYMDKHQGLATARAIASYGLPPPPKYSHFADQLGRQHWWKSFAGALFIIEFFIDLRAPAPPFIAANGFSEYGTTCVQHESVRNYVQPCVYGAPIYGAPITRNDIWVENTVIPLMNKGSIQSELRRLCDCKIGTPMSHSDGLRGILIKLMNEGGRNLRSDSSLRAILKAAGIRYFAQFSGQSPRSWQDRAVSLDVWPWSSIDTFELPMPTKP